MPPAAFTGGRGLLLHEAIGSIEIAADVKAAFIASCTRRLPALSRLPTLLLLPMPFFGIMLRPTPSGRT